MRFWVFESHQRSYDSIKDLCRKPDLYGTSNFIEKGLFSQMRYLVIRYHLLLDAAWDCALDS